MCACVIYSFHIKWVTVDSIIIHTAILSKYIRPFIVISVSSLTIPNSAATEIMSEEQSTSSLARYTYTTLPLKRKEAAAINLAYYYLMILSDLQRVDPLLETGSAQVLAHSIIDQSNRELKPVLSLIVDKIKGSMGRGFLDQMESLFNSLVRAYTSSTKNNFTPTKDMTSDVTAWELLLLVVIEKEGPESIGKSSSIAHLEKGFS